MGLFNSPTVTEMEANGSLRPAPQLHHNHTIISLSFCDLILALAALLRHSVRLCTHAMHEMTGGS